ncbi:MAG: hypothetical protein OSJ56_11850 [Prevotella sp.]|nr:hypothetical protein [Prevotella sp.]
MARKRQIPLMPFDTLAWLSMPGVRGLSPEIRSLWVDLLCLMWGSVERGALLKPNGDPYSRSEINRLLAINDDGVIGTLIDAGLCAWRDDGALISRQIIRGEEIRAKRREAGLKGGNATKAKMLSVEEPKVKPPKVEPPKKPDVDPVLPLIADDPPQGETPPPLTEKEKAAAEKKKKYKYSDFVTLTHDEYAKLVAEFGEDAVKGMIDILNNWKGSNGKKTKSDYFTIRKWVINAYYEQQQRNGVYPRQHIATANPGGGSANNKGCPGATLPANQREGGGSNDEAQKDYSERF